MTTASESCDTTSQMSLFGETCEPSTVQPFGLLPTPAVQEPGILPERIVDRHGNKPAHLNQRLYDKHTGRVVQDGLSQAVVLISSPQAIPASHSHSPGSDWARRMTATYGRKLGAYWLSSDPPDSWVRTLLGISTWGSMTCYLTWKKSVTPAGRLLFRLVPSTPRTAGIGFGLLPTPAVQEPGILPERIVDRNGNKPEHWNQRLYDKHTGRVVQDGLTQLVKLWPSPMPSDVMGGRTTKGKDRQDEAGLRVAVGGKLNSAWVSRMMGYPDNWLTLDGEVTR
jgi:hypothetical protein